MCGILGGTNNQWNYEKALEKMKHRGPDGSRISKQQDITMGFNRLSIIDLSENGMQPMTSIDGKVTIVYNGEIYGFSGLRDKLIKKGYQFRSSSDTEVILNAYCEWEDEFVEYIDGMFAIAIYDSNKNKLLLYRDRAGIKPLYYFYNGCDFAFSSELKGLETLLSNVSLLVDNTALFDFYNYLYIPEPKTLYKNVYKLESGHRLEFDLKFKKIISNKPYWMLEANPDVGETPSQKKIKELTEQVRFLIKESVREQLVADVPVGVFLSGGVDSSVVSTEVINENSEYNAFSLGFYDYERNELQYVRCLEERIGIKSNKYFMKKNEFNKLFYDLEQWYDEPFADSSAYCSYAISREAKRKCTVMLSGDGGDELFGGYLVYAAFNNKFPSATSINVEEELGFIKELTYSKEKTAIIREKLNVPYDYDELWNYRRFYQKDLAPITRLQYMDFYTYLCGDILTKMDRVSMAVSLEVRVPLLSKKIIEFAFSLSQSERCLYGELKGLLKKSYESVIPNNLLYRRKAGFGVPKNFIGYGVSLQDVVVQDIFRDKLNSFIL